MVHGKAEIANYGPSTMDHGLFKKLNI